MTNNMTALFHKMNQLLARPGSNRSRIASTAMRTGSLPGGLQCLLEIFNSTELGNLGLIQPALSPVAGTCQEYCQPIPL